MSRLKQDATDSGAAEVATEGLPVEEKRFQVEVTVEATGYLEVDAPDAETARKKILELTASIRLRLRMGHRYDPVRPER